MESSKERPSKRKQSTSNPFEGTYTRSKSLIYTHQNRSGRARSDSLKKRPHHQVDSHALPLRKKRGAFHGCNSNNCHQQEMSLLSIKDLRARRIFSQPMESDGEESKVLDERNGDLLKEKSDLELDFKYYGDNGKREDVDGDSEGLSEGNPNLSIPEIEVSQAENNGCGVVENRKCVNRDSYDDQNLMDTSPISSLVSADVNKQRSEEHIEDIVQATPPDSVVSIEQKVNVIEATNDGNSLQKSGSIERRPSEISPNYGGSSAQNISANVSGRNDSYSKRRLALIRCAGLKVYRAPSSFSYKRLLPYLMEISKDKSCAVELDSSHKAEIAPSEKLSAKSKDTCLKENSVRRPNIDESIEIATNEQLSEKSQETSVERPNFHEKTELAANEKLSQNSQDSLLLETSAEKLNSDEKIEIASNENQSEKAKESPTKETSVERPNIDEKTEVPTKEKLSEESQDSLLNETSNFDEKIVGPVLHSASEEIPKDEDKGNIHASDSNDQMAMAPSPTQCSTDNNLEMTVFSPIVSQPAISLVKQDPSPIKLVSSDMQNGSSNQKSGTLSLVSSDMQKGLRNEKSRILKLSHGEIVSSPIVGLAKGILKKNPRGCRGLCDCLDCVSFRLHAERAFEFSTNQMKDAEELALDLMREVSQLRCLLEKSISAKSGATISFDEVKEACEKASNAEECAKTHLRQMNEDLYVHCRTKSLQRPRVNFSCYIEEKAVEKCPSSRKGSKRSK